MNVLNIGDVLADVGKGLSIEREVLVDHIISSFIFQIKFVAHYDKSIPRDPRKPRLLVGIVRPEDMASFDYMEEVICTIRAELRPRVEIRT